MSVSAPSVHKKRPRQPLLVSPPRHPSQSAAVITHQPQDNDMAKRGREDDDSEEWEEWESESESEESEELESEQESEQEQESEEEVEQAAPIPMPASPVRNPEPAAVAATATAESTGETRELTMHDAIHFVLTVERALEPAKYRKFISIVRSINTIGPLRVVDGIKALLRGHTELKVQFNRFLPTEYQLRLSDDDDNQNQPEEAPPAGKPGPA